MKKYADLLAKIANIYQLPGILPAWQKENKKIVFTNGCFDIIHRGHVDYLSKAASLGDVLVVGLNTDASVQRLKGPSRPIQDEKSRAMIMASFFFVDLVVFFDEDTPYELIKRVQPDILVKGSDYHPEDIVGYDILMAKHGHVNTIDFLEGFSTSKIIHSIRMDNK
jgi:rfaE bifunctional protein nucleotidyltransferase chain/domain